MKPLIKYGTYAGAITAILALLVMLDVDPFPWPAKAEVDEIKKGLSNTIQTLERVNKRLDRSERRYWEEIEQKALDDLKKDPDNSSAKRELRRAQDAIRELDNE